MYFDNIKFLNLIKRQIGYKIIQKRFIDNFDLDE